MHHYIPDITPAYRVPETELPKIDPLLPAPPPLPDSRILYQVIHDRVLLTQQEMEELYNEIQERQSISHAAIRSIEECQSRVREEKYAVEATQVVPTKESTALERIIQQLEQEKRQQSIETWRDVAKLHTELRNARKELRSAMLDLWMTRFIP